MVLLCLLPFLPMCVSGIWKGDPVAVKIVSHSSSEEPRIARELRLAQQVDHPHLVRALHFVKMSINQTGSSNTPVRSTYGLFCVI